MLVPHYNAVEFRTGMVELVLPNIVAPKLLANLKVVEVKGVELEEVQV